MITPVSPNNSYPSAEDLTPEIGQGSTAVASSKTRNLAVIALIVIGCALIAWFLFGGSGDKKVELPSQPQNPIEEVGKIKTAPAPAPEENIPAPAPALPEPPPLKELALPEPPAPPAPSAETPTSDAPFAVPPPPSPLAADDGKAKIKDPELKQRMEARKRAGIIVRGGKSSTIGGLFGRDEEKVEERTKKTSAAQAQASNIGSTERILAQGKIIDAILETAINTDLPGMLRAVVNRDVYAESGHNILIPKGSRLIGNYDAEVKRGQSRVAISWNRVIRPDGVDVVFDSPGTDALGRAGVDGKVYNRYGEILQNALLVSLLTFSTAVGAEKISGNQGGVSQTENTGGSTTTSGNASDFALLQSVTNLGNLGRGLLSDFAQAKPTITIDQGTKVKVFLNQDLVFSNDAASGVKLVK